MQNKKQETEIAYERPWTEKNYNAQDAEITTGPKLQETKPRETQFDSVKNPT